jgi:spoIIIJ-associated protein
MPADLSNRIAQFVGDVVSAMGMTLEVAIDQSDEAVRVNLQGETGELLLRRKGEGLDALQHITNTVFRRHLEDRRHIIVDCMDYRKGKDAELRQMARFLAEKAKTSGVPQEIGPLNPYARRIVHLAVAEDPQASSESIGDAFLKTVIISARTPSRN